MGIFFANIRLCTSITTMCFNLGNLMRVLLKGILTSNENERKVI